MIYQLRKNNPVLLALVVFFIATVFFAGCAPVNVKQIEEQKNAKQLTPAEVLKLVEGNTLFCHSFQEDSYYYFAPDGTLFGQDVFKNKDTGHWDVTDTGELCMKLQWWSYGDLRCYPLYSDGQKYYMANASGVLTFTAKVYPGDSIKQYHEIKKTERKSFRRSGSNQQPAAAPAELPAEPFTDQGPEPAVVEEQPVPPASQGELKATVKWIAKDCPGCDLSGSNLKKADLVGAKLQGTNLAGANLSKANLRRADMQGANLAGADLSFANMPGANLRGSDLKKANCKGANLIRADLTGAQLEGADFTDALLEGAQGLPR